MTAPKRGNVRARLVLAVASAALLVACQQRVPTYGGARQGPVHQQVLTPDGYDAYTVTSTAGAVDVVALGTNTGYNLRTLLWPAGGPEDRDAESCATWTRAQGAIVQRGAVLRARVLSDGSVRAITVTQNVWFGGYWTYNVHLWDTAADPQLRLVGQVGIRPYLDNRPDGALRFCARAVGDQVSFKTWVPAAEAEPRWNDGVHGGPVAIPATERVAGHTGWYVGHLDANGETVFADLATWAYRSPAGTGTRRSQLVVSGAG